MDRENRIQSQLDDAAQLKKDAEQTSRTTTTAWRRSRPPVQELLAEGLQAGQAAGQQYIDDAKAEAQHIVEQARSDAKEEKQRALDDTKSELASLAIDLAAAC